MASICDDGNGRKRILCVVGNRRPAIRLGKVSIKHAKGVCDHIEELCAAETLGRMPAPATAAWVAGLPPKLRKRIEAAGLLRASQHVGTTLEDLFREFFSTLKVKPGTQRTNEQTRDCLYEYFGKAKDLRDIGNLDAEKWRQWMEEPAPKGKGLATATISKRVKTARRAFAKAVRWKMIVDNPVEGIEAGPQDNVERQFFIDRPQDRRRDRRVPRCLLAADRGPEPLRWPALPL